jgi:hypothetical protein
MPTNLQLAGLVARHVQLHSINLQDASLSARIDPLNVPEHLKLSQSYRARYERPDTRPGKIYVFVDFQFDAAPPEQGEGGTQSVHLEATYIVIYDLGNAADESEEALEQFAELNGAYNAWPYWRELVQTVTGRVGLAAIVVPVFRPPVRQLEKESSAPEARAPVKRSRASKKNTHNRS